MAEARTGKTESLPDNGALMLGGEQDCFGGCTDEGQGYYGKMDEVRIWRTARSQKDILQWMRPESGLENHKDLFAYWKFDEPQHTFNRSGAMKPQLVAKDASGNGNDLPLRMPPVADDFPIWSLNKKLGKEVKVGGLSFRNNYAINERISDMPTGDITVAFWARTPAIGADGVGSAHNNLAEFFSFATHLKHSDAKAHQTFADDAIRIEKYNKEFRGLSLLNFQDISTAGSVSVHINANREGNGGTNDHWMDFPVGWKDTTWHHVAVTWKQVSGETQLYFDGERQEPLWVSDSGMTRIRESGRPAADRYMAAGTQRASDGSLVLGQDQKCFAGCFSPESQLIGDMARVRVWDHVLPENEIKNEMWGENDSKSHGLKLAYDFHPDHVVEGIVKNAGSTGDKNNLRLGADAPLRLVSTAPLSDANGMPLPPPNVGYAGHALSLHDKEVVILTDFHSFPSDEITVEFWMLSTDVCRSGTPFSYSAGSYSELDNAFLIFGYQDWGISVMEDEGTLSDHTSGTSATDGRWHHVAVTWASRDGKTRLYDNGRLAWEVTRAVGKVIPSGGTLILGREQDCPGGCFDSAAGAKGKTQTIFDQEYGPQDFVGLIDEVRIWKVVRTQAEVQKGMAVDAGRISAQGNEHHKKGVPANSPGLVAMWSFDEGDGYVVHDSTPNRHDLHILADRPRWVPVETPFAVCGNGVLESGEECDDGQQGNGDGCSAECRVEPGWHCVGTFPSQCSRGAGGGEDHQHSGRAPLPLPGGRSSGHRYSGGSSGRGSSGSGGQKAAIVVLACIVCVTVALLIGGVAFINRQAISHALPELRQHLLGINGLSVFSGRGGGYGGNGVSYEGLPLDPEDASDAAPEFLNASRPPVQRSGAYEPLSGN